MTLHQQAMLKRLEKQMAKFIFSGLKESRFTNDLYDMLRYECGVFIAHFDKRGFYQARFRENADNTAMKLECVQKDVLKPMCLNLAGAIRAQMRTIQTVHERISVVD